VNAEETVVVIGVAGCGKSTLARELARALDRPVIDADDYHSDAHIAQMRAGQPLSDDQRWAWLATVRKVARAAAPCVVACSGLARRHRDALRLIGELCFVWLRIDEAEVRARLEARPHHFAGPDLVASQLARFELPETDEPDVLTFDATTPPKELLSEVLTALDEPPQRVGPLAAWGGPDAALGDHDLDVIAGAIAREIDTTPTAERARRVLLVPPDQTRARSRAGDLTWRLVRAFDRSGCDVGVLPALGTHRAMQAHDAEVLFAGQLEANRLMVHDWRGGVTELGRVQADEVVALSDGLFSEEVVVEVASALVEGWDLVVSLGQVLPHEVIGMGGYSKNLVVGLGGQSFIGASHLLGALVGIETIIGETATPVRDLVDTAFDRMLAPRVDVLFVLTVVEPTGEGDTLRAVLTGRGGTGRSGAAAFADAASMARDCNVTKVDVPWMRASCWLDADEFRSTWLGNKAIYRTRRALATDAELIVLAPGVERFGEDPAIDQLIRRHGYRGTAASLEAAKDDPELRASPATLAHLIHGSSDGRFSVTYCTDPDSGGLTPEELDAVGYGWRPLAEELASLGVDGTTPSGPAVDRSGDPFEHVAQPALGLWVTREPQQA
jgi:carbohydrate kinase (thermoresistant glucokinase family)